MEGGEKVDTTNNTNNTQPMLYVSIHSHKNGTVRTSWAKFFATVLHRKLYKKKQFLVILLIICYHLHYITEGYILKCSKFNIFEMVKVLYIEYQNKTYSLLIRV